MSDIELVKALEKANDEIETLQRRVSDLERISKTRLPNTWLLSDSFLRRAFGVVGHYFVASMIIVIPLYCAIFMISLLAGGF